MMAPPILPDELTGIQAVLCTHRHTDHMDPETLAHLISHNPLSRVVIPKAEQDWGRQIGIPVTQLSPLNVGDRLALNADVHIEAISAAHEELKRNAQGEDYYVGYILRCGPLTIYHSGDCCPYPGLEQELKMRAIHLALLPINGRDAYRTKMNIIGNFNLAEAVALCQTADIPYLIGHHFGLFDFNTVKIEETRQELEHIRGARRYMLVESDMTYLLSSTEESIVS
jgi:L-ascorbate metabolism protein UlaG (beta-lactamase superfamily)